MRHNLERSRSLKALLLLIIIRSIQLVYPYFRFSSIIRLHTVHTYSKYPRDDQKEQPFNLSHLI